jgi:hypothetical protein
MRTEDKVKLLLTGALNGAFVTLNHVLATDEQVLHMIGCWVALCQARLGNSSESHQWVRSTLAAMQRTAAADGLERLVAQLKRVQAGITAMLSPEARKAAERGLKFQGEWLPRW